MPVIGDLLDCTVGWFYVFHIHHLFEIHSSRVRGKPFEEHFRALTGSWHSKEKLQQCLRNTLRRHAKIGRQHLLEKFLELLDGILRTFPEQLGFGDLWWQKCSGLTHVDSWHSTLMMCLMTMYLITLMRNEIQDSLSLAMGMLLEDMIHAWCLHKGAGSYVLSLWIAFVAPFHKNQVTQIWLTSGKQKRFAGHFCKEDLCSPQPVMLCGWWYSMRAVLPVSACVPTYNENLGKETADYYSRETLVPKLISAWLLMQALLWKTKILRSCGPNPHVVWW